MSSGAVGIEMAAELKLAQPSVAVTLVHSRDKLLSSEGLPDDCKDTALKLLLEAGVQVVLGQRASPTQLLDQDGKPRFKVVLSNGTKIEAGAVIMAISHSIPSTTYLPGVAVDADGYAKIEPRSAHSFKPLS